MTQISSEYQEHFDSHFQYAKEALALYRSFNLYPLYKIPVNILVDEQSDHDAHTNFKSITFVYPLALKLSKEEFAGVLEHELDHILLLHGERGIGKDRLLWNIATDITINGSILKEEPNVDNKIIIPRNSVFDPVLERLSAEEIYSKLASKNPPEEFQIIRDPAGEVCSVKVKTSGKNGEKEYTPDMVPDIGDDIEEIKEFGRKILRESLAASPGSEPLGMERSVVELLNKVKVDWRKELKYYITKGLRDFSFSERDKRFMRSKFFIPGLEESPLGSIAIGVGIDLSGSMTDEDLKKVLTECLGIERSYPTTKFWFVPFDVQTYGKFESSSKDDIIAVFKKFKGGGGTSFVHVIKELDNIKDSKVSLIFTDLYGQFPMVAPKKPLLWLDTAGTYPEVPYGKRIPYE